MLLLSTVFYCILRRLHLFTTLFLYQLEYGRIIIRPASQSTALRFLIFQEATAPSGPGPLHYRGFTITDTTHSARLLCTSDQRDAETST